jgi:hypothetical protein
MQAQYCSKILSYNHKNYTKIYIYIWQTLRARAGISIAVLLSSLDVLLA